MTTEVKTELGNCSNCGVSVRENTFFCYNCGHRVADLPENGATDINEAEARTALAEVKEKIEDDEKEVRDLETAAKERKRSRATKRKRTDVVWVPEPGMSNAFTILISLLIATLVFSMIFLMVLWK
jgi:uncharacterized Zn finger protein (UPF0148 family)